VTQDETIFIYLSLERSSGPRIERYGGTTVYELYYPSRKANARRAAKALNKELGVTCVYTRARLFKEVD